MNVLFYFIHIAIHLWTSNIVIVDLHHHHYLLYISSFVLLARQQTRTWTQYRHQQSGNWLTSDTRRTSTARFSHADPTAKRWRSKEFDCSVHNCSEKDLRKTNDDVLERIELNANPSAHSMEFFFCNSIWQRQPEAALFAIFSF